MTTCWGPISSQQSDFPCPDIGLLDVANKAAIKAFQPRKKSCKGTGSWMKNAPGAVEAPRMLSVEGVAFNVEGGFR
jgi:hypothetical protein